MTNLYDGLFAGGLSIISSEVSAEIAYPVGESLSLGFINAFQYVIRFGIKFTVDMLTYNENDPQRKLPPNLTLETYIILMVMFLLLTILAYVLLVKTPFVLRRSLVDACLNPDGDELNQNEETQTKEEEEEELS